MKKRISLFLKISIDLFKKGLLKYTFNSICNEDKDIVLEDGMTKVFVNASYSGNDITSDEMSEEYTSSYRSSSTNEANERLLSIIKYINTGETSDEYTKKIDAAVISSRKHKSWRNEYMKYRADREDLLDIGHERGLAEGLEQGLEQGIEQGKGEERTKLIKKMLLLDMPYEQIAEIVDIPIEEIQSYAEGIAK